MLRLAMIDAGAIAPTTKLTAPASTLSPPITRRTGHQAEAFLCTAALGAEKLSAGAAENAPVSEALGHAARNAAPAVPGRAASAAAIILLASAAQRWRRAWGR